MRDATLADATDFETWANRRDAQGLLPQLVRRLVQATAQGSIRAGFRSGEGVQLPGWDGIVRVGQGNAFVPPDLSVWELTTEKNPGPKASRDYAKRTENALGVDHLQATFVFLAARRWSQKEHWAAERRDQHVWRDVRAYDADDLSQWLETAPAVHVWISNLLGKHPAGAVDLSTYWNDWLGATDPEMSPELVLAGRRAALHAIHKWLEGPVDPLVVRGESRAESIAVFVAAVQTLAADTGEGVLSRAIIVDDSVSWNQLTSFDGGLILAPRFDCDAHVISRAVRNRHSVLIPRGRSDGESSDALEIPRLSREDVGKILVAKGFAEEIARDLAGLARRSQTAFRRKIAVVRGIEQPAWSRPETSRSFLPALLAGRWSADTEGDREVLAALARKNYDDIHSELVRWSNEDDPPVRCIGTTWYLTSEEDAWVLLGRYLTDNDLCTFQKLAVEVLTQPNPAFDIPDDKRWMAGVIGATPQHSGLLRTGIANTLAILGARGHAFRSTGGLALDAYARSPVRELLGSDDWRVWASLPLGLLAEAAPDEFLDAVEHGVSGDQPSLLGLFRDKAADMFASAPHTGLLFALEALAWSEVLLGRVAIALAKLARIDPGGTWANRPLASLRSIFLLWLPQTTAPFETRLRAIDAIREREPDIAWKAMKALLPQDTDHSHPTAHPVWREWAPLEDVRVTMVEHANGVRELVQRMIHDVGTDGVRWSDLIDGLPQLPGDAYYAVVTSLESLGNDQLAPNDLEAVWDSLRTLVSRHRSYPDADWSLPIEETNRLAAILPRFEPRDPLRRYGWLFGNNPSLPEGREADLETYLHAITTRQGEAVEALHGQSGLTWLSDFIQRIERPDQLGAAFARSTVADTVADELLREHLRPGDVRKCAFVEGFVGTKVQLAGTEWAMQRLATIGSKWSSAERAAFCVCLPFNSSTWEIVDRFDGGTASEYWKRVSPFYVDGIEIETVARRLLEHGRPGVAADLLQHHVNGSGLSAGLVVDVLEGFARCPVNEPHGRRPDAHDISDLLSFVASSSDVDETRIAALEWIFLPALGRHYYTPVVLLREMARKPEFFVQVVALVYRDEVESPSAISDEEKTRAERAYELIQSWRWRPIPGMADKEGFDPNALRHWVFIAREALCAQRRLAMGDYTIGEILSGSPGGDDRVWPLPVVRDLIENLVSDNFEEGLIIGLLNSEGPSFRNPSEGGAREREKASRYEQWATVVGAQWGRTAAMLRRLRDRYQSRADEEDRRAEFREEFS